MEMNAKVAQAKARLTKITSDIDTRKNRLIKDAGVNSNSVAAGFANGSLSVATEAEVKEVYELKKVIMQDPDNTPAAARARNIARIEAKRAAAKAKNKAITPSQRAKDLGCKSLAQVARVAGVSKQNLINWHRAKPELFTIVCTGVAAKLV